MLALLEKNVTMIWILALTLGLAPFNPPHLFDKIKWILGGGKGMQWIDYFDIFLHGSPWILLLIIYIYKFKLNQSV